MIGKMMKCLAAAVAMSAVSSTVFAQMVDNPAYLEWSKFKPGTYNKRETVMDAGGQKMKTAITTTLKEVTPEKVVLEMKTEMSMPGMPQQAPVPMTIPAKIEQKDVKPFNPEQMPNCKVINKGTEDLKVGDSTYKCNWYEVEMTAQGMTMKSKMWVNDEVLGKLVKNETSSPMKSTTTLVEVKIVK